MHLHDEKIKALELKANEIRQDIISSLVEAGSGHSAGPLGMADIFTLLYFHVLEHDPKNPDWDGRDRLILSNGHICPALYTALAHAGYFPREELTSLRKLGTRLQGHPHRESLPGLETTSGPLGTGLSQAIGVALGFRMDGKKNRVYCLTSDGEHDEGNTWEAAMFAGKEKLANLTAIMDRNNIQIDGPTERVMPLEPMKEKYEAFNWHVCEVNGHSFSEVHAAIEEAKSVNYMPTMIIAHTIPGRGVDFMEHNYEWHGKPPDEAQAKEALAQLRTLQGRIASEHE